MLKVGRTEVSNEEDIKEKLRGGNIGVKKTVKVNSISLIVGRALNEETKLPVIDRVSVV